MYLTPVPQEGQPRSGSTAGGRHDHSNKPTDGIHQLASDCRETLLLALRTEQQGVCAGGKEPPARSKKMDFSMFPTLKNPKQRVEKTFSTRWLWLVGAAILMSIYFHLSGPVDGRFFSALIRNCNKNVTEMTGNWYNFPLPYPLSKSVEKKLAFLSPV